MDHTAWRLICNRYGQAWLAHHPFTIPAQPVDIARAYIRAEHDLNVNGLRHRELSVQGEPPLVQPSLNSRHE